MDTPSVESLAKQFAPVVRLYPYESNGDAVYNPSSVPWFLGQVQDVAPAGGDPTGPPVVSGSLAGASGWLQIPDEQGQPNIAVRQGDLPSAPVYINFRAVPQSTCFDLQYWMFYPVRGMSTLRITHGSCDRGGDLSVPIQDQSLPNLYLGVGEHQGDWKHLTVRLSSGESSMAIAGVFFGQHGSGVWLTPDQVTYENGRLVVYSARNTHSCMPTAGRSDQLNTHHDVFGWSLSLLEWAEDGGPEWDTSGSIVVIGNATDPSFSAVDWNQFLGNWGPTVEQDLAVGITNALDAITSDWCADDAVPSPPPPEQEQSGDGFWSELEKAALAWLQSLVSRAESGASSPAQQHPWLQGDDPPGPCEPADG